MWKKQQIIERSEALKVRQSQIDDMSILPKVGLEDVPAELPTYAREKLEQTLPVTFYPQGTNGLVYQQLVIDLPELDEEETAYLPLFSYVLTELGAGDSDYLMMQERQAQVCGGIGASTSLRATLGDRQKLSAYFVMSSKALVSNFASMSELMYDSICFPRFDEVERLKELVSQRRSRREQSITGQGHVLAMTAASSGVCGLSSQQEAWGGMSGIQSLKALDDALQSEDQKALELMAVFARIHDKLLTSNKQLLVVGEAPQQSALLDQVDRVWASLTKGDAVREFALPPVDLNVKKAWLTSTQVNFCAKSFKTIMGIHPDVAPLTVLGGFLRNGYLHRVIREQGGAYGGGATFDSSIGAFRFYSYRDPRLTETLNDFDASLKWLATSDHSADSLEEAILGVIGSMDKPGSPAGEAQGDFFIQLHGRTKEQREMFRAQILAVTIEQLQDVAKRYLTPENESIAVISSPSQKETLTSLGFDTTTL